MNWTARPQANEDLIAGRNFIQPDNPRAARVMQLSLCSTGWPSFPRWRSRPVEESSAQETSYFVMSLPFNRWLVFYEPLPRGVEIVRVIYGTMNWKQSPNLFN